jgi:hypothetical protein
MQDALFTVDECDEFTEALRERDTNEETAN